MPLPRNVQIRDTEACGSSGTSRLPGCSRHRQLPLGNRAGSQGEGSVCPFLEPSDIWGDCHEQEITYVMMQSAASAKSTTDYTN